MAVTMWELKIAKGGSICVGANGTKGGISCVGANRVMCRRDPTDLRVVVTIWDFPFTHSKKDLEEPRFELAAHHVD